MCVSLAEVQKSTGDPEKRFRGSKKDPGLGLIAGPKKSWRSKKRHAAAENKMDQSRGLEKDISGSKKKSSPLIGSRPTGSTQKQHLEGRQNGRKQFNSI